VSDIGRDSTQPEPLPSVLTVANVVYGLHAAAIVIGIAGSATVIGSFVGSLPSIAAVILNYAKRSDARGTWAASHYRWQIRTFWYALLWFLVGWILVLTLVGIPIALVVFGALTLWLVYRRAAGCGCATAARCTSEGASELRSPLRRCRARSR
jgi:uncharacterized membrane protein